MECFTVSGHFIYKMMLYDCIHRGLRLWPYKASSSFHSNLSLPSFFFVRLVVELKVKKWNTQIVEKGTFGDFR